MGRSKKTNSNKGVYQIVNLENGKKYIGSSVDLTQRKWRHFSSLRKNTHDNSHLQAAWNKYGESNFSFSVLEYGSVNTTRRELLELESHYIFKYNTRDSTQGYNQTCPIESVTSYKGGSLNKIKKSFEQELSNEQITFNRFSKNSQIKKANLSKEQVALIYAFIGYHLERSSCKIRYSKRGNCLSFKLGNQTYFYYSVDSHSFITKEQYDSVVNPKSRIFQIEPGTSTVLKVFESVQEVLQAYPNITPKSLDTHLYNADPSKERTGIKGIILILEEKYNQDLSQDPYKLYTIKKSKVVEQIDSQGNILKTYPSAKEVITHNPHLSLVTLRQVLVYNPTQQYPFRYKGSSKTFDPTPSKRLALINLTTKETQIYPSLKVLLEHNPSIKKKGIEKVLYKERSFYKNYTLQLVD